jgi:hypothetical protein
MGLRYTYQFGVLTSALSITAPFKRHEFDDAVHHIIAFQASRTQYELSNHLGNACPAEGGFWLPLATTGCRWMMALMWRSSHAPAACRAIPAYPATMCTSKPTRPPTA